MSKRNKNNGKTGGIKVNPQQKQMLAAAQAATVEKTAETTAENDNDAGFAQVDLPVTPPKKDERTQQQRRKDRLDLREKALQEAVSQGLPFFDGYPAAKFEEDYAKAFKEATTCEKAIPANEIVAKREATAASIKAAKEGTKTPTQELIDAAKASQGLANDNLPAAEMDNTNTSKDAADLALMQEADKLDKSPVAVVAEGTVTLVSHDGDIVGEKEIGETTTVTYEGVEYIVDAKGELVQRDGETKQKFGQRKHAFKGAKYRHNKAIKDAAKAAQAEAAAVAEFEGRNGSPPSPSDINKNLPMDIDDEGKEVFTPEVKPEKSAETSMAVFENAEKEANESASVEQNKTPAETPETTVLQSDDAASVDSTEVPNNAPVDTQQEPAEQTTPPVVDEVKASTPAPKPKMTPQLVVDNEKTADEDKKLTEKQSAEDRAAAKKFYGSTWTDERATKLTQALIWLNKAIEADKKLRDKIETEGPKNNRTVFRLAMNAALRFESEALGYAKQEISVEEITGIYGPAPLAAKSA